MTHPPTSYRMDKKMNICGNSISNNFITHACMHACARTHTHTQPHTHSAVLDQPKVNSCSNNEDNKYGFSKSFHQISQMLNSFDS